MHTIQILGAGGFATEIEEMAHLLGYDDIAFLDENPSKARCKPVVGGMADIAKFREKYDTAIVALGNNEQRLKYHLELEKNGYFIPTLIHPSAYVSPDAVIEPGCILRNNVVVGRYVHLGKACILNIGAIVDHDCVIGEGTHCLIGSVVRNSITITPKTWINPNEVRQ